MSLLDGTRLHLYASLVGLACYLNAPACDFVFDDAFAVVSNADVQPGAPLLPLWSHDFWGKACVLFHHLALSLSLRPFTAGRLRTGCTSTTRTSRTAR